MLGFWCELLLPMAQRRAWPASERMLNLVNVGLHARERNFAILLVLPVLKLLDSAFSSFLSPHSKCVLVSEVSDHPLIHLTLSNPTPRNSLCVNF